MARNPEQPRQVALPPELIRALHRLHTSVTSQGYLGTAGDLAREILARELTGRRPVEVAFATARVAGSNRGYFFAVTAMRRCAKAVYDFLDHDEQVFGMQRCSACGGPILPQLERVLAELNDAQAVANVARIDGAGDAPGG